MKQYKTARRNPLYYHPLTHPIFYNYFYFFIFSRRLKVKQVPTLPFFLSIFLRFFYVTKSRKEIFTKFFFISFFFSLVRFPCPASLRYKATLVLSSYFSMQHKETYFFLLSFLFFSSVEIFVDYCTHTHTHTHTHTKAIQCYMENLSRSLATPINLNTCHQHLSNHDSPIRNTI